MSFNTIPELAVFLRQFSARRGWEDVHNPKNLAMALSVEAAELAEHFQWLTEQQSLELEKKSREGLLGDGGRADSSRSHGRPAGH